LLIVSEGIVLISEKIVLIIAVAQWLALVQSLQWHNGLL
jgi:hypothetical protein